MSERDARVRPLFDVVGAPATKVAWMEPGKPEVRGVRFAAWSGAPGAPASGLFGGAAASSHPEASAPTAPDPEPEPSPRVDEELRALEAERQALGEERAALRGAREALDAQRERLVEAIGELGTAQARALGEAKQTLIDLAVGIAEVIVGRALEEDASVHENLARVALGTLGEAVGVELRGSPQAYDMLVEVLGAPEVSYRGVRVPVLRDETVEGLGFVATAGRTRVDGRVAGRLDAIHDALLHELRVASGEPEA